MILNSALFSAMVIIIATTSFVCPNDRRTLKIEMEKILVGKLKNTMCPFGRRFISSGFKEPKAIIQLKGNSQHIQSRSNQSNYIRLHHMCQHAPFTIRSGIVSIWDFQQKTTLFHHPNSSMAYIHSQTTSPKIDADNNYDCNLISFDSGAHPCDEYETIFESKEDDMNCEQNKRNNKNALRIQQQFRQIRDTANKRMFELQEEFDKMQRISFEFECLTELSSYDEKFTSLEESLAQLQKAISISDTKIHKVNLGNQNVLRITKEINQRSKQHSEFNDEIAAMNSRHLTRLQLKLNNITKELMKQSLVLDEWKLMPEQNNDQLKKDFNEMLAQRLKGVKDELNQQRVDILFYHITLCGLVLVVLGSLSFEKIIAWLKLKMENVQQ